MSQFTPIELRRGDCNGNGRHNNFGCNNIERQIINCDLMNGTDTPVNDPEHENGETCLTSESNNQKPKRTKEWGSYTEFLLASLSYAVGLGNIWRFPYLVYRNGGGAFFVPYFVMLFFVGIPLFVLEFSFGQYMQRTPVKVWVIAPLFSGIGYAMCLMSGLVSVYYNMIIAWSVRYLTTSLFSDIAWSKCNNTWNTNHCLMHDNINCTKNHGTMLYNGTCLIRTCVFTENSTNIQSLGMNPTVNGIESGNVSINCSISDSDWLPYTLENSKMPSDEYFHREVLGISNGLDELGSIRPDLAISLFICWIIVAVCLYSGFKSMGKTSYFTAIFPYIVLTILLFRCVALDGAYLGISFYITPKWERITNTHVWSDAAMQIFFSLSPCWGGIITLAKGNNIRHNFIKDAFYISIGNCLTSIYAGFVIFSIIGFMAHDLGSTVEKVVAQGAGLAFIAYPEAVSRLPISRLWAILFFTMLCTLGFGTQFTLIESVVATISETIYRKPTQRQKRRVLFCTVTVFFFSGLILCTNGGMYILQLMDDHIASYSALLIGLVELKVIVWVYGVDRFLRNGQLMLGNFPMMARMWKIIWMFITPFILASLLGSSIHNYTLPSYGDYRFPEWSAAVGWMLSLLSVSAIPIVAFYKILSLPRGNFCERARYLMKPSSKWTPPQLEDDLETDSEEGSSSDGHGSGNVRRMQVLVPRTSFRRSHHQAPPHCDSQTALRDDEESVNQDDDDDDENEVMSGVNRLMFGRSGPEMDSSRTLLNNNNGFSQFSRNSSFDSDSETGINMRIFPPSNNNNPPRRN